MTCRLLSVASLRLPLLLALLALLALPGFAAAASGPVLYEGGVSAEDFTWTAASDGSYHLELEGGRALGVTGQADLPGLELLLLVPEDLAIVDVSVEATEVRRESVPGPVAVAPPLAASNGDLVPVGDLEPVDGVFPPSWGSFGGLHTWRGFRLLALTVHPLRLAEQPGTGETSLLVAEHFVVRAVVDPARVPDQPLVRQRRVPGERAKLDAMLRALVANPRSVSAYAREDGAVLDKSGDPHLPTPNPSLEGSGVRYLIVTTEAMAGEFQRLADHRTATGLPAMVITREWIAANHRQGIDFQDTMRMFLQEAYGKWGVEYLLIGGDTEVIPTRTIRSTFYPFGGHTDIPTDLYFAALDGNWGADGDGWLGEPYVSLDNPGDNADMAPDLSVARAPVRSATGASHFVDKILAFETATPADDYGNRILYAAEVLFPSPWNPGDPITLDGAEYAQTLIDEIIIPCTDMEYVRMFETNQSHPYDLHLTREALITELNSGNYGQVNQFGHGHFFNMSVGNANFTVSDADGLTNAPNFFFLVGLNCASAAFDVSCLMEAFVENPDGGAVMSLGAAREAFPSNTFGYQKKFYEFMACGTDYRPVDAFTAARLNWIANTDRNTVDRWTQLNAVFIGDPATALWNGTPRAAQIVVDNTITVGEQQLAVQVTAGGSPVPAADVCARKGDETYAWGVTDAGGNVVLTVIPSTAGELEITASSANLAVTSRTVTVNGADTYLAVTETDIGDAPGNGNGLPEAGETISLTVHFEDVGGSGASGLTATFTSTDNEIVIIDGEAPVADVPPGGTTQTTSPFYVQVTSGARDGSRIAYRVTVTDGVEEWTSECYIDARAPEPDIPRLVVDDAAFGNGNGVPESGERLVLYPYLKNYGSGRLDQVVAQLVDAAPGVTIDQEFAVYGPLELLEEGTYVAGGLSVTLTDIGMANPCAVIFTDNYGRTFTQPLQFTPPPAPPLPEADATIAADAIALRWEANDPAGILGYNVYRASAENGPFVRTNQDLLEGIAYFEDRGLQELTPYWYKVTAVDTFHCESDFSPVVTQGTMPAELENFPLPFQLQTSGHSAVGDVDGDGDLEVVIASDEVYVWHHDGSELIDGDDDSQTTGPLTGVGGQFEPAGVVLANLDGQPGLEIIASERSNSRQIHVYRADGTLLPGWPRTLLSSWNWATPAVGDVDGDGDPEVVVNDTAGRTFVWHHDGTELRDGDGDPATDGVFAVRPGESWGYSAPALYDLDGDGACEIICGTKYISPDNGLLAYRHDGSQAAGFPVATGSGFIICAPAIADLDDDGVMEIIFFTESKQLYVVEQDGDPYPGFPISTSSNFDDSPGPSPAVGNFDGDSDYEIVWPVNGGAFRMDLILVDTGRSDGTAGDIMSGWPIELPCNSEGSPVVGDINGDGVADILQPVGNSETDTPDLLYAFNADGSQIDGFPIRMDGHCRATPTICDLDRNGTTEVVYGSWDRLLHVWDLPYDYTPGLVPWGTFQATPARTGVAVQASVVPVEDDHVPDAFTVQPPYPNPFNPTTHLRLYVAPGRDTRLEVSVFDLRGRRVRQLFAGEAQPGWHDLSWDGRDDRGRRQSSGVYFLRAQQAAETRTFKMTLVK